MFNWTRTFAGRVVVALSLAGLHGPAIAAAETTNLLADGIARFRAAEQAWDVAAFTNAAARFETAARRKPDSGAALYWRGASLFHALVILRRQDPEEGPAKRLMREAVEALEAAVELRPEDAESHALLSTLAGMRIGANPLAALWYGPAVLRHRDRALQADPENPRVHYLIATSQYHAPRRTQSRDRGLAMFLKAADLFEVERKRTRGPLAPRWGYGHCLAFIGRLYQEQHDIDNAVRYYRDALDLNPRHGMAKEGLEECLRIRKQNQSS